MSRDRRFVSFALVSIVVAGCTAPSDSDGDEGSSSGTGPGPAATTSTAGDSGADSFSDGADSSEGEPVDCIESLDCVDPLAPICQDGECVGCGSVDEPDEACGARDALQPVCGPDDACVQCSADQLGACDDGQVCDVDTGTCGACTSHDQCPESACDFEAGTCFSDACVVDVDADGARDYLDITSALADVAAGDACVLRVHPLFNDATYGESVVVSADRRIALLAVDGRATVSKPATTVLSVQSGAVVYAENLEFVGTTKVGAATLRLDRVDVRSGYASALHVGGEASVVLVDSWLEGQDLLTQAPVDAVVVDGGSVEMLFTTVVGDRALACDATATATIRNALLLGRGDDHEIACPSAVITYSATEGRYAGVGNQALGPMQAIWIDGNLPHRLSDVTPEVLASTARWSVGDPTGDIDGDARQATEGAMDFAGADVP